MTDGRARGGDRAAVGRAAERLAAERLAAAGWRILAASESIGRDELDLVAVDPGPPPALVVVEVRSVAGSAFGGAAESAVGRKLVRTWRGALALVAQGALADGTPLPRLPLRVDLVTVDGRLEAGAAPRVRHRPGCTPEPRR
ncbi:MAG: YraN family protein [Chloroflexota bacterium]